MHLGPSHPQQQVVETGHRFVIGRSAGAQTPDPRPHIVVGAQPKARDSGTAGRVQVIVTLLNRPITISPRLVTCTTMNQLLLKACP